MKEETASTKGKTMSEPEDVELTPVHAVDRRPRFSCWIGQGLPKGWAKNMGYTGDNVGDVVYPIVDNQTCGPIHGSPRPEQMLCWCPTSQKQSEVVRMLRKAAGVPENEDWLDFE